MRRAGFVAIALVIGGCTGIPRAELTAYTSAYADVQAVTNGVLDIVAPYERVVIRFASRNTTRVLSVPAAATASSLTGGATIDPSLLADPGAARAVAPPRIDASLLASPGAPRVLSQSRTVVVERPCRGFGGVDPYCYEMRDGYADIGDPPLVAAYRNVSDVVMRFNNLLVAYSDGISGRLLRQELEGLSSSITELSKLAPITSFSGAGTFAASFSGVVSALLPVASLAGGVIDRSQLRSFLLANYDVVDQALLLMAVNSSELYANVATGTQLYQINVRGMGQQLNTRRRDIRRLVANWTVLLDDTRRALRELKIAIEFSDGLETRIRNLDAAVLARISTASIKKQIATLGTPVLAP